MTQAATASAHPPRSTATLGVGRRPGSTERLDLVFEASSGMGSVRRLVLDLAVRGRLVEADPSAVPPHILNSNEDCWSPHVGPDEDLLATALAPPGWAKTKLGQVVELRYGRSLPKKSRNDLGSVPTYGSNGVVGRHDEALVLGPCIVVGRKGSSGAVNLVTEPSWPIDTTYFVTAPSCMSLHYLFILLRALRLDRFDRSTAIPGLNRADAYALTVLIPPLAEQNRIVAKVDQLMALCDDLEARQAKQRDTSTRLTKSALQALTTAEGPEEFDLAWKRIVENFDVLIDRAEKIGELRSAILSLAMRGALLGASARPERDDGPYPLPAHWAWRRLSEVVASVTDGDHQPPPRAPSGIAFLTIGNVSSGRLDFTETRFVPRSYFEALDPRRVPVDGDLLYTVVGATYGRPVRVENAPPFCVQRHIAILRPNESCERDFLFWFLRSPLAYGQATASITGTAQPTVALGPLRRFLVPVPPLAEQRRLTTVIERFMALCDELEARLADADKRASQFVAALVSELVVG